MPKKGRKNALDVEREREPHWLKLKDTHSEVESNINSLEHHGLDRCPDNGLNGYKRYAGLGVLAYHVHRIGKGLLEKTAASRTGRRAAKKSGPPEEDTIVEELRLSDSQFLKQTKSTRRLPSLKGPEPPQALTQLRLSI